MSKLPAVVLVFFVSVLAGSYVVNAGPAKKSQPTSTATAQSANMHMAMPLYAPLFIEGQNYSSTLTMVNELTVTVHAAVIVRRLDGSTIGQRLLTFPPHSREVVRIKDILNSEGASDAIGSLAVLPNPMEVQTMAIGAQLSIVAMQQFPPAYFEEELLAPDPMQATQYRAVAPPAKGSALVTLLNTTAKLETLTVTCLTKDGGSTRRNYSLAAFQLVTAPACGDPMPADPAAGLEALEPQDGESSERGPIGVDASSDTGMGTFAVWGLAPTRSEHSRVVVSMNFINSAQVNSPSMIFAGVPVGVANLLGSEKFTPELAVANFSLTPATVTVSYSPMSANNPENKIVASFSLSPGAVRELELRDLAGDPGMRNSFAVTSDARPGAVIGNLISRGQELYPAVQLIGKDALDVNNGGGHPWSISNGTSPPCCSSIMQQSRSSLSSISPPAAPSGIKHTSCCRTKPTLWTSGRLWRIRRPTHAETSCPPTPRLAMRAGSLRSTAKERAGCSSRIRQSGWQETSVAGTISYCVDRI